MVFVLFAMGALINFFAYPPSASSTVRLFLMSSSILAITFVVRLFFCGFGFLVPSKFMILDTVSQLHFLMSEYIFIVLFPQLPAILSKHVSVSVGE